MKVNIFLKIILIFTIVTIILELINLLFKGEIEFSFKWAGIVLSGLGNIILLSIMYYFLFVNKSKSKIDYSKNKKFLIFNLFSLFLWAIFFFGSYILFLINSQLGLYFITIMISIFLLSGFIIVLFHLYKSRINISIIIFLGAIYLIGFISFISILGKNFFSFVMAITFMIFSVAIVFYGFYIQSRYLFLEETKLIEKYILRLRRKRK